MAKRTGRCNRGPGSQLLGVGRTTSGRGTSAGSGACDFPGGPKTLRLIRFVASVENVIKGRLPAKMITFFFFAKLDQNPTYYLYPGRRYIISLRNEGGVFRSWADARQLKIEIHSGAHEQRHLPLDLGPRRAITYILLTPGPDCSLHEFASTLDWPRLSPDDPSYVNERLRKLEFHPDREVRESACFAEAVMFWHRPKCLLQALESPDGRVRSQAAKLTSDDVDLPRMLRAKPFPLFSPEWFDYMRGWLEVYTDDVRPEVRKAACDSLRSLTSKKVEGCQFQ